MTSITVALPYYNAPIEYVEVAIRSLLAQTISSWVGFVLDDSPDGSPAVEGLVRRFADKRLRYVRNEGPHGIGHAWNACRRVTQTELTTLLHTDDAFEPNYIQTIVELSEAFPEASIYFCGASIVDAHGRPCFSLPDRIKDYIRPKSEPIVLSGVHGCQAITVGDFIPCPTMTYRNSQRRFSGVYQFVLDWRFVLEELFAGNTIVGTHRKAYRYRRHNGQATSALSRSGKRFVEESEILDWIELEARARGWRSVASAAKRRMIFRLNVSYEMIRDTAARRPIDLRKIRYILG